MNRWYSFKCSFQRTFIVIFAFRAAAKEASSRGNRDDFEDSRKSLLPNSPQLLLNYVAGHSPRNLFERQIPVPDAGEHGRELLKVSIVGTSVEKTKLVMIWTLIPGIGGEICCSSTTSIH